MEEKHINKISIVLPAYNEEAIIKKVLDDLKNKISNLHVDFEIIVVNDGSTDKTKTILENQKNIKLINHPYNKGYGASLKTGAKYSKYNWLFFMDTDGQHKTEQINDLIKHINKYDMIIGAREGYKGPWIRQPGKKILTWIASYLVDYKIPDLNSGFRLVKKNVFNKFLHLYPNNFSLTTTITMASIKEGFNIRYVPITINKRIGKSTVHPKDALRVFVLITRIITLFSPMKFFFPVSLFFMIPAIFFIVYDIIHINISDTSIALSVISIFIFLFGILLDQIAAVRRELNN